MAGNAVRGELLRYRADLKRLMIEQGGRPVDFAGINGLPERIRVLQLAINLINPLLGESADGSSINESWPSIDDVRKSQSSFRTYSERFGLTTENNYSAVQKKLREHFPDI